jgi:hypothetical protein
VQLHADLTRPNTNEKLIWLVADPEQRVAQGKAATMEISLSSASVLRTVARTTPPSNRGDQNRRVARASRWKFSGKSSPHRAVAGHGSLGIVISSQPSMVDARQSCRAASAR